MKDCSRDKISCRSSKALRLKASRFILIVRASSDCPFTFPALAAKNNMALVPFLLKGVGGVPALNQKDGIHPTAEGAKIVGGNVWEVLNGILTGKN